MAGLAGLQFLLGLILGSYLFVTTQAVGVSGAFEGIQLFLACHFACKYITIVARFTFADFHAFGVGDLLAVSHAMMTVSTLQGGLMSLMRENSWFRLGGTGGLQFNFLGSGVGAAYCGDATKKERNRSSGHKGLFDHDLSSLRVLRNGG